MDTAKSYWLFLKEFPFPHHHGVRYDSQAPSAVPALSLNHQFSPRIFGLHTVGNWLHVDEAKWFDGGDGSFYALEVEHRW